MIRHNKKINKNDKNQTIQNKNLKSSSNQTTKLIKISQTLNNVATQKSVKAKALAGKF